MLFFLHGRYRVIAADRQILASLLRRRPGAATSAAATSLAWKEICLQLAFQGPPARVPNR